MQNHLIEAFQNNKEKLEGGMETVNTECKPRLAENLDFTQISQQADMTEEDNGESPKTYNCTFPGCDKNFRYRSEIMRHTVTHTNHRPYVCPYKDCCKGFKRSDALATHIRIHTGDKPFKCPVGSCQLTFSTKAGLRYHILKHKNNKLYKCDYPGCDQSFLTMSQLKQHKRGAKVHESLQSTKSQDTEQIGNNIKNAPEMGQEIDNPAWYPCNEYEPPVQKKVMVEKPAPSQLQMTMAPKQIQQLSVVGLNVKANPEKIEANNGLPQLFSSPSQNAVNGNASTAPISNFQSLDLSQNMSLNALKAVKENSDEINLSKITLDDQTKLLKSINKVLDENMALKRHLELCQKIIGIYQSNLGGVGMKEPSAL